MKSAQGNFNGGTCFALLSIPDTGVQQGTPPVSNICYSHLLKLHDGVFGFFLEIYSTQKGGGVFKASSSYILVMSSHNLAIIHSISQSKGQILT